MQFKLKASLVMIKQEITTKKINIFKKAFGMFDFEVIFFLPFNYPMLQLIYTVKELCEAK